jgi:alpha-glucosidase
VLVVWHGFAPPLFSSEPPRVDVQSPDGKNHIALQTGEAIGGLLKFTVIRNGTSILEPGSFDVRLAPALSLAHGAKVQEVKQGTTDDSFELLWGKTRVVRNRSSWARVKLTNGAGIAWEIELRAHDDGVAFRYSLPEQPSLSTFQIVDELTELRFAGAPSLLFTTCKDFKTDHETEYQRCLLDELPRQTLIDLPLLATWAHGSAAAITEARVRDFTNMYLERTADSGRVTLRSRLSPLNGQGGVCVAGRVPHYSPWRVVLLGDRAGLLLESNLLLCLNDERPATDFAWARPGKTTWHWWNGVFEEGLSFPVGMNLATHKYYVDFCARNGIAYHAVVSDDSPWYVQSRKTFSPGPDTDIVTPRPELQLPELLAYAKARGVGIRLWVHWKPLDARLEEAFQTYEAWGVSGLMVDFLDRDDQQIVNYCERVLDAAARHKLHVQFHGSYKPSGEQRTFPHLFNREGVLNLEYLKWSTLCTPDHNLAVAYTRTLAGPLDYHLGGFRSASRATFRSGNHRPFVLGTRCHHLAMYVVYENPMPMVCDIPSGYDGQPGFDFITTVPTTWDATRFVIGEAGQYIALARRKDDCWYLAAMTNWTPRKLEIPLSFLGPSVYTARIYRDGSLDEEKPNEVQIDRRVVTASESLPIELAPGGGLVAVIQLK